MENISPNNNNSFLNNNYFDNINDNNNNSLIINEIEISNNNNNNTQLLNSLNNSSHNYILNNLFIANNSIIKNDNLLFNETNQLIINSLLELISKGEPWVDFSSIHLNFILPIDKSVKLFNLIHSRNWKLRYFAVVYHAQYFNFKFNHNTNINEYITFITNLFFEENDLVFNKIDCYKENHIHNIFNPLFLNIINDKRFNEWMDSKNQKSISCFKNFINRRVPKLLNFVGKSFTDNNEILSRDNLNWYQSYFYIKYFQDNQLHICNDSCEDLCSELIQTSNISGGKTINTNKLSTTSINNNINIFNNGNNTNNISNNNSNNSNQIFNNYILSVIIEQLVIINKSKEYKLSSHSSICKMNFLSVALVSKKFFKMLSNILSRTEFLWFGKINFKSNYSLVSEGPLFMDYDKIKLIDYSSLDEYFSRVNHLYIQTQAKTDGCSISNIYPSYYYSCKSGGDPRCTENQNLSQLDYLVFPSKMPELKKLTFNGYLKYDNFQILANHITSYSMKPSTLEQLEFTIKDGFGCCSTRISQNFSFLSNIFKVHSNSLQTIIINYESSFFYQDMLNLLNIVEPYFSKSFKIIIKVINLRFINCLVTNLIQENDKLVLKISTNSNHELMNLFNRINSLILSNNILFKK